MPEKNKPIDYSKVVPVLDLYSSDKDVEELDLINGEDLYTPEQIAEMKKKREFYEGQAKLMREAKQIKKPDGRKTVYAKKTQLWILKKKSLFYLELMLLNESLSLSSKLKVIDLILRHTSHLRMPDEVDYMRKMKAIEKNEIDRLRNTGIDTDIDMDKI
jgi:hypothetical protein